jgi:predicted protein tyrosine phosphatase
LLGWANQVFVMERRLVKALERRFGTLPVENMLVNLDVPDDFQFMQPELVDILLKRLRSYLGEPDSPRAQ